MPGPPVDRVKRRELGVEIDERGVADSLDHAQRMPRRKPRFTQLKSDAFWLSDPRMPAPLATDREESRSLGREWRVFQRPT